MARILIADDSPQMLRALRTALQAHPGWEVCGEASDGLEAVNHAAQLSPDIVILDLTMPKLNGLQAARTIHTAAPKLPLLLFTQHEFKTPIDREARDSGFSGAVNKGSCEVLIAAVEALLRGETFFALATPNSGLASAAAASASGLDIKDQKDLKDDRPTDAAERAKAEVPPDHALPARSENS